MSLLEILGLVGNVLDTPGSSVRDLIAGENPFDQWMSPHRSENRVSGREMLQSLGLLGENTEGLDWGDVGGFAAEVVLDPTNLIGGAGLARKLATKQKILSEFAGKADDAVKVRGLVDESGWSTGLAETLSGNPIGEVALMQPAASEYQAAQRMFGEDLVPEGVKVARVHGSDLEDAFHGRGIGQQMYLDAMADSPADWFYNSGNSDAATRAREALARKGLAELHWYRDRPGMQSLMRLTPEGREMAGTNQLVRGLIAPELPDSKRLLMALGLHNLLSRGVPE